MVMMIYWLETVIDMYQMVGIKRSSYAYGILQLQTYDILILICDSDVITDKQGGSIWYDTMIAQCVIYTNILQMLTSLVLLIVVFTAPRLVLLHFK